MLDEVVEVEWEKFESVGMLWKYLITANLAQLGLFSSEDEMFDIQSLLPKKWVLFFPLVV